MNNEMLWAKIIVLAWQDATVFAQLQALARSGESANDFLVKMATQYASQGFPQPNFPPNVQTRIVIDTPTLVHLIMPPVENIPPSSIDMVPHAL
jgi:hypothetical protein